jgi:hypothetical protein
VHALVPLHVFVMHDVDVHVSDVPPHPPPEQVSSYVHGSPSSQIGSEVQTHPSTGSSRQ